MENIKRIAQLKEKRRKQKEALRIQESISNSSAPQQDCKSERFRKFSSQSYESAGNPLKKSVSVKITNLDTSHSQYVEEDDLQSFTEDFKFDTLGHIEVSSQFLQSKSPEQLSKQAFAIACQRGDIQTMNEFLMHKKIGVNTVLEDERNFLHIIISSPRNSAKAVSLLLDNDIDVNKQNKMGRTPLIIAALKSNINICKLLIQKKCKLDIQDMYGNTALHYACTHGWFNIAKLLIANNARTDLKNKNQQIAEQCCTTGQVFKLFNSKSEYTRTIVDEYILKNGRNDHVQKLLDRTQQALTGTKEVDFSQQNSKKVENKWKSRLQKFQTILKQQSELETTAQSISHAASLLQFKCIDLLGKGSFGQVYLVEHELTKQLYAMKVLNKSQIRQNKLLPYVQMERKILSMVRHPFIVGLHYAFQTYDKLILIMTYCPGGDLLQLTKKNKKLSEELIKKYAAEIVLGIQCLHKAEIIYRDLKPANVVLDKDGHACITDFGLAKQSDIGHSFCGSMAYLAPQMLSRRGHTRTIDWYLLGVLIYQCSTGKPPFWDTTRQKLILNIKSGIYVPFQGSQEMKDIVSKLLRANPAKRLGGTNDAEDVKAHPWFKDIDWKAVQHRKLSVPAVQSSIKISQTLVRKSLFTEQDIQKGQRYDRIQNWQYCMQ